MPTWLRRLLGFGRKLAPDVLPASTALSAGVAVGVARNALQPSVEVPEEPVADLHDRVYDVLRRVEASGVNTEMPADALAAPIVRPPPAPVRSDLGGSVGPTTPYQRSGEPTVRGLRTAQSISNSPLQAMAHGVREGAAVLATSLNGLLFGAPYLLAGREGKEKISRAVQASPLTKWANEVLDTYREARETGGVGLAQEAQMLAGDVAAGGAIGGLGEVAGRRLGRHVARVGADPDSYLNIAKDILQGGRAPEGTRARALQDMLPPEQGVARRGAPSTEERATRAWARVFEGDPDELQRAADAADFMDLMGFSGGPGLIDVPPGYVRPPSKSPRPHSLYKTREIQDRADDLYDAWLQRNVLGAGGPHKKPPSPEVAEKLGAVTRYFKAIGDTPDLEVMAMVDLAGRVGPRSTDTQILDAFFETARAFGERRARPRRPMPPLPGSPEG